MKQPKNRSKLRQKLGSLYYTLRTYISWYFSKTHFTHTQTNKLLPVTITTHQTPLRRPLANVPQQMQENKIKNLALAIQTIDALTIKPGETFSYWKSIGKPTKRRGFADGMILYCGNMTYGVGGGLCQLSNLIYWMTLHTPLTVTERWRHSYDVFPDVSRTQPFGSGATCSYPNIDLKIQNNTDQIFQLHLKLSDTHLIGEWRAQHDIPYSYNIIEREHHITHEPFGAYSRNNTIVREVIDTQTHEIIAEEFVTKNCALMMYSPLLQ